MKNKEIIFDFNEDSILENWRIVDDVVMGGRSSSKIVLSEEGTGVFSGNVSLENNGGFASVQYELPQPIVDRFSAFKIHIRGDGKKYQFRAKYKSQDKTAHIYEIDTDNTWQEIIIPCDQMLPGYRGKNLDLPPYSGEELGEIAFLIANQKDQNFRLEINYVVINRL